MKNPYIITNKSGQYWVSGYAEFVDYGTSHVDAANDGMGILPHHVDAEIAAARLIDSSAEVISVDSGSFLPKGHVYYDGRYAQKATVLYCTEDFVWVRLENGGKDEFSKSFYIQHIADGVYRVPA